MKVIGNEFTAIIDRPIGYIHHDYPNTVYPINYGYIEGIIAGDGMYQDVYILGVEHPITNFTGTLIAIIKRINDCEDKWVLAPIDTVFTEETIRNAVHFQEKYFDIDIIIK
ncbi:MAG: inorganic pyrophosphatase [Tissierellia bacterium]|nr:inorganic pyrophosphatase [Tissierellia bacterium]